MTGGAGNQLESTLAPLWGFLLKFSWTSPDARVMEMKTREDALLEGRDCIFSCSVVITKARRKAGEHLSLNKSLVNIVWQALWGEFPIRSFLWYSQFLIFLCKRESSHSNVTGKETKAMRVMPLAWSHTTKSRWSQTLNPRSKQFRWVRDTRYKVNLSNEENTAFCNLPQDLSHPLTLVILPSPECRWKTAIQWRPVEQSMDRRQGARRPLIWNGTFCAYTWAFSHKVHSFQTSKSLQSFRPPEFNELAAFH